MLKFAFKFLRPIWDWFAGGINAIFHLGKYKQAKKLLIEAKREVKNPMDLEKWYEKHGLKYISDKALDYAKRPWVTIADGGGDCEDFTALSFEILDSKTVCHKGYCNSKNGAGHSIMIAQANDLRWWLMSNEKAFGTFETKEDAAHESYRKMTDKWFFV